MQYKGFHYFFLTPGSIYLQLNTENDTKIDIYMSPGYYKRFQSAYNVGKYSDVCWWQQKTNSSNHYYHSLTQKYHFDEIFITAYTGSCHFEKFLVQ